MSRPDLDNPGGRRAYGAELGRVARGWRWPGLAMLVLGSFGIGLLLRWRLSWGSPIGLATAAVLAVALGLIAVGIVKRTRYHRARMQGWPGA